jgi:hypothetical protein
VSVLGKKNTQWWIVLAFILVPLIVSVVSTIHVISFFELSNYYVLALVLALSFELGALSGLAALTVLDKLNKNVVWFIFVLLTAFQMVGNTYYAYDTTTTKMMYDSNLIKNFSELFGFDIYDNTDVIFIKRIIAILTGGILPVISLSFLHLLMSYVGKIEANKVVPVITETPIESEDIQPIIEIPEKKNEESPAVQEDKKTHEAFDDHLERKRKKLEEDKKNFFPLLSILFRNGTAQEGDELPSYSEFMAIADSGHYSQEVIKVFLTLCNFLDITKMNGELKRALMSYDAAKKALDDYLSFDYQVRP